MDLSEIPTDDLADELARRFDLFFCVGMRRALDGLEDEEEIIHRSHGDAARLIGVIEREKVAIVLDQIDEARDVE